MASIAASWVSAVLGLGASALGAQAAFAVDGVGNVPGCVEGGNPASFLASEAPGGPWNRVIVDQQYWGQSWYHPGQCIAAGFNSGYAEYITFKWNPGDTVGQAVRAREEVGV